MTEREKDDLFFVCTIIELVGRKTKNLRGNVVKCLTDEDLEHQLRVAEVNHCLPLEQVADEWIEDFWIPDGDFDSVGTCRYTVPPVTAIRRVYEMLISSVCPDGNYVKTLREVFSSFLSDEISWFNSNIYYSSPEYLRECWKAGAVLD